MFARQTSEGRRVLLLVLPRVTVGWGWRVTVLGAVVGPLLEEVRERGGLEGLEMLRLGGLVVGRLLEEGRGAEVRLEELRLLEEGREVAGRLEEPRLLPALLLEPRSWEEPAELPLELRRWAEASPTRREATRRQRSRGMGRRSISILQESRGDCRPYSNMGAD